MSHTHHFVFCSNLSCSPRQRMAVQMSATDDGPVGGEGESATGLRPQHLGVSCGCAKQYSAHFAAVVHLTCPLLRALLLVLTTRHV